MNLKSSYLEPALGGYIAGLPPPGRARRGRFTVFEAGHTNLNQPPSRNSLAVAEIFASSLKALLGFERGYVHLGRLTESASGFEEPEAFCRRVFRIALDNVLQKRFQLRLLFYHFSATRRPGSKLFFVIAAMDSLDHGYRDAALSFANRAMANNQHDLFAQRLYRKATGQIEPDLRGRFCVAPFEKIDTYPRGDVHFCCPAWLPAPLGNLHQHMPDQIWNSPAARDIRASILDGSYRYCSRMHCPKLSADQLPRTDEVTDKHHRRVIAERQTRLARGPIRVVLSHDKTCNLSCPSCRTGLVVARREEQRWLIELADRVILPLIKNAHRVHICGSGEPFVSHHFRHILMRINRPEFPKVWIELQTNGLLFDRRAWHDLELEGLVRNVYVSIDAARAETYRLIRRGGSFERLMRNLAFVAELRRDRRVRSVRLDFVVQAQNYREMPDVVDITKHFGFDGLKFQMIRNWGTFAPEAFARHNIGVPTHPEHGAFLEVLKDRRLQEDFVEFWGFYGIDSAAVAAPLRSR